MKQYETLALQIMNHVGGEKNIKHLTHCITRLRFVLVDETKVHEEALLKTEGVITTMKGGGQFQVVIGNHVSTVYDALCEHLNFDNHVPIKDHKEDNTSFFQRFIQMISSIFTPIISSISAAGIIKGINALLIALGVYGYDDGAYIILQTIGDAIFMYLPVIIGYSASKKFGLKPLLGIAIGLALCYPAIQLSTLAAEIEPLYTIFQGTFMESPVFLEFFGIPLIAMDYTSSVLPVILIVFFASKLEIVCKKWIPQVLQFFLVPVLLLLISLFLGFFILGPIATFAANGIGAIIIYIYNISPMISGAFVGFFWQILVIFGVHWGTTPIYVNNVMSLGYDAVTMPFFGASFAQTAVVLAIYLKTKNKQRKELCVPAAISGLCGITEPAIYGITLPLKKPFIISCIAAGIAGGFYGLFELKEYVWGGIGIFEFPSFINPETGSFYNMYIGIIGAIIAFVIGFVATLVLYKETEETKEKITITKEKVSVLTPISGNIKKLSTIKDKAFAQGALGKGIAISPTKGEVIAPFDGTIITLFPTKHAIGILSDTGIEMLIHIGMDTVQLEGKHFKAYKKQGDRIIQGEPIISFDITAIEKEGYSLDTPIVITNYDDYLDIVETNITEIQQGEEIFTIL